MSVTGPFALYCFITIMVAAGAVAAAIDSMFQEEILGSVAGDDAIIVITKSPESAKEVEDRIKTAFRMV